MSNQEVHTCHDCGYQWKHGDHGGHSCARILKQRYEQLHTEKATLLAAIDTYRFCHIQLKNTVEFADNGEASYVADEVLMSKFDAANDFAVRAISGTIFYPPAGKPFNLDLLTTGQIHHSTEGGKS